MSDNFGAGADSHIYRPKQWTLALNLFSLFFVGIVMGGLLIAFVLMAVTFSWAESRSSIRAVFFICMVCMVTPLLALMGFNIIQLTISTLASFLSYIKITPDGIEQKNSPYKHIHSSWSEVDRIGKLILFTDVIYLNSFSVMGLSLSLRSPLRFLRPTQGFISVSGYNGWPDGQLASDLKQYAPRLFANQTIFPTAQPKDNDAEITDKPSISQESQLLAAISHVSVLFSPFAILVPIAIYATQRARSSYLRFQALQAFVWQIAAFVFNVLSSFCMGGAILIPILVAASSQNAEMIELSNGGMILGILAIVSLMSLGNLLFTIYGVVGAIATYRGKDFRYAFIANFIESSNGSRLTNSA